MQLQISKTAIRSWMLFDWAAQPFFTVVITFIFGPYFVAKLAQDPVAGQTAWSHAIAIAGFIIAIFSPVLGSIADATGSRKPWILCFALIKIIALCALWFASPGHSLFWPMTAVVLAMVAAEFSIVFNDSMMPRLIAKDQIGRVSNLAWGLGYAGGLVVLFSVLLLFAANAETGKTLLGLDPLFSLDPTQGEDARITAPIAAIWYAIFILPMLLFTPDISAKSSLAVAVKSGLRETVSTIKSLGKRKNLLRFFLARMIFQDGVNGLLALGGAFAAGMFAWQTTEMGIYGILLLVAAIFGCIVASKLDQKLGAPFVVNASLLCLLFATVGIISTGPGYSLFGLIQVPVEDTDGLFATAAEKIYIGFGVLIGLAFGPVQASSRAFLAQQVSVDESGRFFGLYALTGRATSFLAPMSVMLLTSYYGSTRIGMAALVVFLLVGWFIFLGVKKSSEAC
jgi:MFS transporter, UMF1 family